jgi:hypothetical protein
MLLRARIGQHRVEPEFDLAEQFGSNAPIENLSPGN